MPDQFSDRDILFSTLGLICMGQPHFESIDLFKTDRLFKKSLGLLKVPSKETLRQRIDRIASDNNFALDAIMKWELQAFESVCFSFMY